MWCRLKTPSFAAVVPVIFFDFFPSALTIAPIVTFNSDAFGPDTFVISAWRDCIQATLAFASCAVIGSLSDKYGRWPMLAVTCFATAIPSLVLAATMSAWAFVYVTVGAALLGVGSGPSSGVYSLVSAYIADVTSETDRAPAFAKVLAVFGLTFTVGSIMGAMISEVYGNAVLFWLAAGFRLCQVLYVLLFLPESFPAAAPAPAAHHGAGHGPAAGGMKREVHLRHALRTIFLNEYLCVLAVITFLTAFSDNGVREGLLTHLVRNLHFTEADTGIFLSVWGFTLMLAQSLLMPWLNRRVSEQMIVFIGAIFNFAHIFGFGVATTKWQVYVCVTMSSLAFLGPPAANSLMSKLVAPEEQGAVQGSLSSLRAVTSGFAPLGLSYMFRDYSSLPYPLNFPGVPFVIASVLLFVAMIMSLKLLFMRSPLAAEDDKLPAAGEQSSDLLMMTVSVKERPNVALLAETQAHQ